MKRSYYLIAFLLTLFASSSLYGQLDKDKYYFSLGYGILPSNKQNIELLGLGKNTSQNPISLAFEIPLSAYFDDDFWNHVSAGVVAGYSWNQFDLDLGNGSESIRQTYIPILFRAALCIKEKRSLSPYIGFQVGQAYYSFKIEAEVYDQSFADIEVSDSQGASGVFLGLRFGKASSNFFGFVEVGTSIALLTAGLTVAI